MTPLPVKVMAAFVLLVAGEDMLDSFALSSGACGFLKFILIAVCVAVLASRIGSPVTVHHEPADQTGRSSTAARAQALAVIAVLVAGEKALVGCGLYPSGYSLSRFTLVVLLAFVLLQVLCASKASGACAGQVAAQQAVSASGTGAPLPSTADGHQKRGGNP